MLLHSSKRLIYLILGMALLVLAACTSQSGPLPNTGDGQTPVAESDLRDTKWSLVSFEEAGSETQVIEGSLITLELDAGGQAGGSAGCNSYGTQYEIQYSTIFFGEITRTLMACEQEGIGQQEDRYIHALETAGRFQVSGERLTIWFDEGRGTLSFTKLEDGDATATP
jgi:heat shock protein HslJ